MKTANINSLQRKLFLTAFILFSASFLVSAQSVSHYEIKKIKLPVDVSIRAISVVNHSTVWFAGTRGIYGFTLDGGDHWTIDSIKMDTIYPEFRSIVVKNSQAIFMLNIGSPAYLLKSMNKGKTWKPVYTNKSKDIFFDSIKFSDQLNGFAVSDPVDGCFVILRTRDGGETWKEIECSSIPPAWEGEACFASSNTCVDAYADNIWIATGGNHARVLYSANNGNSWTAYETPIMQGEKTTGIYSMDFVDEQEGIIVGGNYDKKDINHRTKAITHNGGKNWYLINDGINPPFGSCVQYMPSSIGKFVVIACLPGIYLSNDGGKIWNEMKENGKGLTDNYYTFQFSPNGKVAWFAGEKGKMMRVIFHD